MATFSRQILGTLLVLVVFAGGPILAGELDANGVAVSNGGVAVTTTDNSIIQGGGTYQITGNTVTNNTPNIVAVTDAGSTLEVNGAGAEYVNVQGAGSVFTAGGGLLLANGSVDNQGVMLVTGAGSNITMGGAGVTLDNASTGVIAFQNGGSFDYANGTATNSGVMIFDPGSALFGTTSIDNHRNIIVDTAIDSSGGGNDIVAFINNVNNLATSNLMIRGDAANIASGINYTNNAVNSTVILNTNDSGVYANSIDVHNSDLQIWTTSTFNGAVTGTGITVMNGVGFYDGSGTPLSSTTANATFLGAVNAGVGNDFQVGRNASDTTAIATFGAGSDLQTGNVVNFGRLTFNNGSTFSTAGTVANNNTLTFNAGMAYTGTGLITNNAIMNADANINQAQLTALMGNTNMATAASVFNLMSANSATLTGAALAFNGVTAAGSTVNIGTAGRSIAFAGGTTFNASRSNVNIVGGSATTLSGTGAALTTAGNFAVGANASLNSVGVGGINSITAASGFFAPGSNVNVGTANTLNMNFGAGAAYYGSGSAVNVANYGRVNVAGASNFAAGSTLNLQGTQSKYVSSSNINFDGGSTMHITGGAGGATDISTIESTGGNININGATNVVFTGSRAELENKDFLIANAGAVNGKANLRNSVYLMDLRTYGSGQAAYVSGVRSVIDVMADAFGSYDYISVNKHNGGKYTDAAFTTYWGMNDVDLNTYVQMAGMRGLGFDTSFAAFGQLYGEYAAYSSSSLMTATGNFRNMINNQMNQRQNTLIAEYNHITGGCSENPCSGAGVCGGDPVASSGYGRLWGGGFGDWNDQDDTDFIRGYNYNAGGVILGYNYSLGRLDLGFASAYTHGILKVTDLGTKYLADMVNLGIYGSYTHESGIYAKGSLGYGHGWNDYNVEMVLGGGKRGEFQNNSYSAGLEMGYMAKLPCDINFIPSVGVDYTYLSQDGWTEDISRIAGSPILANYYSHSNYNSVDIPLAMRMNKVFDCGGGVSIMPEARAAWIYQAHGNQPEIEMGYAGMGSTTTMYSANGGHSRWLLGAGLKANFSNTLDASVDYNYMTRDRFSSHNLNGTVGVNF